VTEVTASIARPGDIETDDTLAALRASVSSLACTAETYPEICNALVEVKARSKALEAQQKTILDPLRAAERAVKAWFKAPLDTYKTIEGALKDHVARYQDTLRAERYAAIQAAGREPTPEAMQSLTALAAPPTPPAIQMRKVWKVEVTDEDQVPREYMIVDVAALRALCIETKGELSVPGVRFYQEDSVAVGAK
jgi:hypothetical protein